MRVLVDMDGVLACFVTGMCRAHGRPNPFEDGTHGGRYFIDEIWGMEPAEFWEPADEAFWAGLDPTPEAHELVALLEAEFGIESLCLLSSPSANLGCIPGKLRWIDKHFPQFSRRFLFGTQKQFCAGPDHLLIDDWEHNVESFRAAGGHAVLFPRPWNPLGGGDDGLSRVKEAVRRWKTHKNRFGREAA